MNELLSAFPTRAARDAALDELAAHLAFSTGPPFLGWRNALEELRNDERFLHERHERRVG
jgi:hypothetical protein